MWTYGYNSEPAPNMTPASIALHADDLLASMMSEYRKCLVCTGFSRCMFLSAHMLDSRVARPSSSLMGSGEP